MQYNYSACHVYTNITHSRGFCNSTDCKETPDKGNWISLGKNVNCVTEWFVFPSTKKACRTTYLLWSGGWLRVSCPAFAQVPAASKVTSGTWEGRDGRGGEGRLLLRLLQLPAGPSAHTRGQLMQTLSMMCLTHLHMLCIHKLSLHILRLGNAV